MVQIFSDSYSRLNSFKGIQIYLYESKYSTFDTVSVFEYLSCIFIISTSNYILFDMVDIIRIRIRIRPYI